MLEISVLLPVRDAAPWLGASLASLWRQSFADFEVVAVDDGSRDGSGELLERAAARERRLRVLHTPPRGLPSARTAGLAAARGRWIARHDADDLSRRDRFERQRDFLAREPRIAVAGCRVRLFPAGSTGVGMRRWAEWHNALLTHDQIAREALIDSPLAHGTAMIRREALERAGGWEERGWPEDMDLWLRLLEAGERFGKLPIALYAWRQHAASSTRRDPRYRTERCMALKLDALARAPLLRRGRATLVGVGASLERWRAATRALPGPPIAVTARGPGDQAARELSAPLVLVFSAAPARARWRVALERRDLREMRDFIFVS